MNIVEVGEKYREPENEFPLEVTCEYCRSKLELEEKDLTDGPYGAMWYRCPVCKRKCMCDEAVGIQLTGDNIVFPKHFNRSWDGVDIDPDGVKEYIKQGIDFFRENPNAFTYVTGSGNTGVMVQNYSGDEEYLVVVTKDYYSMIIPYESVDYDVQEKNGWQWENNGVNLLTSPNNKRSNND